MLPRLITAVEAESKWRERRGLTGEALIRSGEGCEPEKCWWLGVTRRKEEKSNYCAAAEWTLYGHKYVDTRIWHPYVIVEVIPRLWALILVWDGVEVRTADQTKIWKPLLSKMSLYTWSIQSSLNWNWTWKIEQKCPKVCGHEQLWNITQYIYSSTTRTPSLHLFDSSICYFMIQNIW